MPAIKHILFPFDFSAQGMRSAPFVRAMAERFDAKVTLIGVVPPVWVPTTGEMPVLIESGSDEREKELRSRLDRTLHPELVGITVERVTALGDPATKIVEFAHGNSVDLIMMPTHGFGVFRSMLLGSVTSKVLHDAKCPVWTSAHAEEQHAPVTPKTVVCGIEGPSEETLALVHWASEFSKNLKADLRLLHIVPPVSDWLAIPTELELHKELREQAYAQLEPYLRQTAKVDAPLRVVLGKVADTLPGEAKLEHADLLVIGRGAAHATLGRLRSHVFGIIQQSECPVVSV
jgi:nucleotide-binding universal stress UspA family protein